MRHGTYMNEARHTYELSHATHELMVVIYMNESWRAYEFSHVTHAQVVVGGTNMNKDITNFKKNPDILVATPGRLNDHLENGNLGIFYINVYMYTCIYVYICISEDTCV